MAFMFVSNDVFCFIARLWWAAATGVGCHGEGVLRKMMMDGWWSSQIKILVCFYGRNYFLRKWGSSWKTLYVGTFTRLVIQKYCSGLRPKGTMSWRNRNTKLKNIYLVVFDRKLNKNSVRWCSVLFTSITSIPPSNLGLRQKITDMHFHWWKYIVQHNITIA